MAPSPEQCHASLHAKEHTEADLEDEAQAASGSRGKDKLMRSTSLSTFAVTWSLKESKLLGRNGGAGLDISPAPKGGAT
jgi:hypothetical protein